MHSSEYLLADKKCMSSEERCLDSLPNINKCEENLYMGETQITKIKLIRICSTNCLKKSSLLSYLIRDKIYIS